MPLAHLWVHNGMVRLDQEKMAKSVGNIFVLHDALERFGRDALITSVQALGLNPELAMGSLRYLAAHQGRRVDPYKEEEPGKIMHEIRFGELAHLHQVPHTPYYGSVDATPLFLVLLVELLDWTGDVGLLAEEYDPTAGRQLGNYPQAFSHVCLVNTARNLAQEKGGPCKQRHEEHGPD